MSKDPTDHQSPVLNPNFRIVGDENVVAGRETTQRGWYEFAATFVRRQDVLDVGCGLGEGVEILARTAQRARGIDLDNRLLKPNILKKDIAEIPSKSVDAIVCIDVIEHVEADHTFVGQLARVARQQILLSTPNYTATRCAWPYHVREYLPHELHKLFAPFGKVTIYKGSQSGNEHYLVRHLKAYLLLNQLRVRDGLPGFAAQCVNHYLPMARRIHSHLFIRVLLSQ